MQTPMSSTGPFDPALSPAAPIPPPQPLSLLEFARTARRNFIASLHAEVYERDIVELKLIGLRIFIVNDPAGVRHVLLHNAANYPKSRMDRRILGPAMGNGLFLSEGAIWRMHRRIMTPCFDQGALRRYAPIMVDAAQRMSARWGVLAPDAPLEVCDAMMTLTLTIISRTMFSSDGDAICDVARESSRDYQEAMMLGLADLIPGIGALWATGKAVRAKRILRRFDDAIRDLIYTRTRESGAHGHSRNDLLQRLVEARDEQTNASMSAREVRDQVFTILMAGHETTALALTWTWYLLSRHPDVEAGLHAELDRTLGARPPCHEDLQRLTYTRMVVEEALRLYPPVHSLAWREALRDDEICGRAIPRGSTVSIVPWVLHRHRRFWRDPERFDPERFAPARSAGRDRLCYLPFGFGPRICLGAAFAMAEAVLVLASVAQRYRLRLAPQRPVEAQALFTLRPRHGLYMTPWPRRR